MIETILLEEGCSDERAKQVLEIIAQHSTEHVETVKPTSNEAKVLFDADKLDGMGVIGIARVFALFGQMGKSPIEAIAWYRNKISLAHHHLQTEEGRRLFEARLEYVVGFLLELEYSSGDKQPWP